jgi:hypothetical protein
MPARDHGHEQEGSHQEAAEETNGSLPDPGHGRVRGYQARKRMSNGPASVGSVLAWLSPAMQGRDGARCDRGRRSGRHVNHGAS